MCTLCCQHYEHCHGYRLDLNQLSFLETKTLPCQVVAWVISGLPRMRRKPPRGGGGQFICSCWVSLSSQVWFLVYKFGNLKNGKMKKEIEKWELLYWRSIFSSRRRWRLIMGKLWVRESESQLIWGIQRRKRNIFQNFPIKLKNSFFYWRIIDLFLLLSVT